METAWRFNNFGCSYYRTFYFFPLNCFYSPSPFKKCKEKNRRQDDERYGFQHDKTRFIFSIHLLEKKKKKGTPAAFLNERCFIDQRTRRANGPNKNAAADFSISAAVTVIFTVPNPKTKPVDMVLVVFGFIWIRVPDFSPP